MWKLSNFLSIGKHYLLLYSIIVCAKPTPYVVHFTTLFQRALGTFGAVVFKKFPKINNWEHLRTLVINKQWSTFIVGVQERGLYYSGSHYFIQPQLFPIYAESP